jgi:hypothetical protein
MMNETSGSGSNHTCSIHTSDGRCYCGRQVTFDTTLREREGISRTCSHRWEPSTSAWGTIIGVTKCLDCGVQCRTSDFPALAHRRREDTERSR